MKVTLRTQAPCVKILTLVLFSVMSVFFSSNQTNAQAILTEDFSYTASTALTSNGWTNISGTTNTITVSASSLSYPQSPSSGVGGSVSLTTSGEDLTRSFTSVSSGTLYASFLVKVNSVVATADYFFALYSGAYTVRFNVKSSGSGFVFGISKSSNTTAFDSTNVRTLGTTYLVVIKYQYNSGSATDDVVSYFVNPTLGGAEPAALITRGAGQSGDANIDRVALRQNSGNTDVTIDGIRVGTTWASVTPAASATAPSVTTTAASSINGTTANTGGNVTADGGATVTRRGLIYSTGTITDTTSTTGGGKIIDPGTGTGSFTTSLTGLSLSTTYNIKAFAVNSAGVSYGSNASFTTLSAQIAAAPTAQPTSLAFSSITCNGMTVSWTAASGNPEGYLVLRTSGAAAPNTDPSSQVAYSLGATLGNATVAYVGSSTSFSSSSLTDSTTYNYTIYAYNGSGTGISYLTPSPLTGNTKTLATSALTATAATNVYSNALTANWSGTSACASSTNIQISLVDSFENRLSLFTASGGSYFSGYNSTTLSPVGTGVTLTGLPSTAPFFTNGSYGFGSNGNGSYVTTVLTSVPFKTSALSSPSLSFKLSALSYNSAAQGMDASDSVKVEISPDNGTTWYQTLSVKASITNGYWAFSAAGVASTPYDGDNNNVQFTGNGSGTGLGTVVITNLPQVANMRVRITWRCDNASELWLVDDFKLTGTVSGVTGSSYNISNLTSGSNYTYQIASVGTNATTLSNTISVSTTPAVLPTLNNTAVSNITNTGANISSNVVSIGSTASISERGFTLSTSSTDSFRVQDASATTGAYSKSQALSPETRYYLKGYAINAEGTGYSSEINFYTLSNPPLTQPTDFVSTPFSSTQINLSWTNGTFPSTGAKYRRYLLLRATAPNVPVFTGSNANNPTVDSNTTIVSDMIGYDSTQSTGSANVTGLIGGETYNFLLIPFCKGSSPSTYNYLTTNAITVSGTTSNVAPPGLSAPTVSNITNTTATLGASVDTAGDGNIIIRGTVYSLTSPVDINDSAQIEGQTMLGAFTQLREYLNPQSKYYFAGYAINDQGGISLSPESSFYTWSNPPLTQPTSLKAIPISGNQIKLTWNPGTYPSTGATKKGYLILRSLYDSTTNPNVTSGNGQAAVADSVTTVASTSVDGADSVFINNAVLAGNTRYVYKLVPFTWDGTNYSTRNYLMAGALTADTTTFAAAPTSSPTSLSFSNITCNGMTLTWKKPTSSTADGYIVLRANNADPSTDPTLGVQYAIGDNIGNAKVVYTGSDTSFAVSSIDDATSHYYKIYSYNGSGNGNISYKLTSPLTGVQATLAPSAPVATAASSINLFDFTANWNTNSCSGGGYQLDVSTYPNFVAPSATPSTIAFEKFDSSLTNFTLSRGSIGYSAGNAAVPATPMRAEGTHGLYVNNNKSTITSNNIDTRNTVNNTVMFRLAAFASTTANGLDLSDSVTVEVSTDGGVNYYKQLQITGTTNSNCSWGFSGTGTGLGIASRAFSITNSSTTFTPLGTQSGEIITTGYGRVILTDLPSVSNLKIKISLANNGTSETWAIDSLVVFGYPGSFVTNYNSSAAAGITQVVSGLTPNTNYYYRVRSVGTGATSVNSNVITVKTQNGFPTLSTTTATAITPTSATIGATVTSAGGSATISDRGTVYKTSSGVTATDNALTEGGTDINAYTQSRTGLTAQTKYYFAGYATNTYGTGLSAQDSFYTLSNPPLSAVSGFAANTYSGDEIRLTWTPASFPTTGATVNGYLIVRANYPNVPSISNGNGQSPVAGVNSTVVSYTIAGSASTALAGGLAGLTQYNFIIIPFTWDGTNPGTYHYYTTDVPMSDATTLSAVIALAATNFSASNITCNGVTIGWTPGVDADGSLVLQTSGSTVANTNPAPGVFYSAGDSIGNAKVVYAGSANAVNVSGLTDSTRYNYKIYSYNGSGSNTGYLTASTLTGNATTLKASTPVATSATNVGSFSFQANWNAASCASSYLLYVTANAVQDNIAAWTFPTTVPNLIPDSLLTNSNNRLRSLALISSTGNSVSVANPNVGGYSSYAVTQSSWNTVGRSWQVIVNTRGYTNLKISSRQYSSASGPKNFKLQYKFSNNGSWADVPGGDTIVVTNGWATSAMLDNLALPSTCNDKDSVFIRWYNYDNINTGGTAITSGGTNRIDDIYIKGDTYYTLSNYNGVTVNGTSKNVTGLNSLTNYYYTVKAVGASGTVSDMSNTIAVTTYADPATADYRTKASGNFSDSSIWEYNGDGVNYSPATFAPGSTNNIFIRPTDSVFMDKLLSINSGKSFIDSGKLQMGDTLITGAGTFKLLSTGTIYLRHEKGLGYITNTGNANADKFNAAATYVYNGTVQQTTSILPTTLTGNLIINNPAGVTNSAARTINLPGSMTVMSNAKFIFGNGALPYSSPYSISGSGYFTAKSGSTLEIVHTAGIANDTFTAGAIRTRLVNRTFENNVNYIFKRTEDPATALQSSFGSAFGTSITSINHLTIDNPKGVNLSTSSITVNGTLNLVRGKLNTGNNTVKIAAGGSVTRTDTSWVVGNLEKAVSTGATALTYEVGVDSLLYTPVALSFGNVTTAGSLSVKPVVGLYPYLAGSALSASKRLNFYASVVNNGVVFDQCAATINYNNPANILGGANYQNLAMGNFNTLSLTLPTVDNRTSTSIRATGLTSLNNLVVAEESDTINFRVKAFLQGFYNAGSGQMKATLNDQELGPISTDPTATDTVTVNLWSASNLSNTSPDYSYKKIIHKDGLIDAIPFFRGSYNNSYYVAIKHRNSVETWSAAPVQVLSSGYDFTTSVSQAYGDGSNAPMKNMGNGVYALYGGDVNQDGTVDGFDLQATENDASEFAFGYNATDCTGDGASDGFDMQLIENNSALFLFMARPY